jgi:hypothetical protein
MGREEEGYGQSKAMNVILPHESARPYHTAGAGIVSLSLHPGALKMGLQKYVPEWFNVVWDR